jgi:hypothetical protein
VRQVPDQPLGGDARHGVVSMVDAALAIIQQRISQGGGNLSRIGGAQGRTGDYTLSLMHAARTNQELHAILDRFLLSSSLKNIPTCLIQPSR